MAKKGTISIAVLHKVLDETETGLNDKNRILSSITDAQVKKIIIKGRDAAIASSGGGAAAAVAASLTAALGAGGIAAAGSGAGAAIAFTATPFAVAGGAATILGGPIAWIAAGVVALVSLSVGHIVGRQQKSKADTIKEAVKEEAIAKQNRLVKEQAETIKILKQKQQYTAKQNSELKKVINGLIDRIDYLAGLLAVMQSLIEACT